MSEYYATISWTFSGGDFSKRTYSRAHTWSFDGGCIVPASSSPSVVRVPYSEPANVDPEEALVAAISSCHMLSFLSLAAQAGLEVLSYTDEAVGVMEKNSDGRDWVAHVTLHPKLECSSEPSAEIIDHLHHRAHEECFIANSVKTEVHIEPR